MRRSTRSLLLCCLAVALGLMPAAASAGRQSGTTYRNAVTDGYSIDFPDPTVMRGKDGYWYAYVTGGPYDETGAGDSSKMARSADLIHWQKLGPIFSTSNFPSWADPTTGFWAPDIRYLDGRYVMYFVAPNTTASPAGFDAGIGVATAPTPAGPWKDSGQPLVPPRKNAAGGYTTVLDPAEFTDSDGQKYLYYGGFDSGDFVLKLSADGLSLADSAPGKQVASTRFEGPYVVKHGGYYWLMASSANCCAGPVTGYTVFAGRSTHPTGPFVDDHGVPMLASRSGGTIVVAPNGSRWIGTGHNAMVTDDAGQTWLAYHAIDRNHPYLDGSPGFTMRPMLLDRLDWINGWPTVRGGAWASDDTQPGPVTTGLVDDRFGSAAATARTFRTVSGSLSIQPSDPASDSGGFARLSGASARVLARAPVPQDVRVEADVRVPSAAGSGGLAVRAADASPGASVTVDAATHTLVVRAPGLAAVSAPIPAAAELPVWHTLAVEVRDRTLTADLTDARLADPLATVTATLPARVSATGAGFVATGSADVDNFSATPLPLPHTDVVPQPKPGAALPANSDDFTGGLGAGWTWINQDPEATVADGQLSWPTEDADLANQSSNPGVLLRDPPSGDYLVETKLALPIGVDTVRNYQQAGIVVYVDRQTYLRLDAVAVGTTRFVEFGKQMRYGALVPFGSGVIGPPGDTTYLRIARSTVPGTGEQRFQAGSSTDGTTWRWGMAWTLPADAHVRIGLVSQGSSPAVDAQYGKALAQFDYFHVSQLGES
ncbi:MAG: family 43 glycosylhydrolase [Mycobacteriales bacterium]